MATNGERLEEIRGEIAELLREAEGIVREEGPWASNRAQAYWIPQIKAALGSSEYNNMCSMLDTINDINDKGMLD